MLVVSKQRLNYKTTFITKSSSFYTIMVNLVYFISYYSLGLRNNIAFDPQQVANLIILFFVRYRRRCVAETC